MKRFGSILDFTKERNNDIMKVYRKKIAEAGFIFLPAIFELVANSPAERFYVSPRRATLVISTMASGKPMPRMRSNKVEMFNEIYRRYQEKKKLCPEKSIKNIVPEIVYEPAPKFYLTARTLHIIVQRINNGWYDKHIANAQHICPAKGEREA